MIPEQRVVVTGLGVVSSIGTGREAFWNSLLAGRSGVAPVRSFDTAEYDVHVAAEIPDFAPERYLRREPRQRYGRSSQLGIAAARLALEDAGLAPERLADCELWTIVGTTMGESDVQEAMVQSSVEKGYEGFRGSDVRRLPDSVIAANVAHELRLPPNGLVIPTACAAGNYAIGHGYDLIATGRAEVVLAGGCDAFSKVSFAGFARMLALAPEKCQPFDRNRHGIVIGEGAGILVLESLERVQRRGAAPLAELLGYGLSCDAHHMTIPHVDGIAAVMRKALRSSGVAPEDVGAISAHGTGTRQNDKTECEAIHRVFGARAAQLPVYSIKSMLGHTMGAASALEALACVLSLADGRLPPTINYETPDEECVVDCVPNRMRQADLDVVLNNAFAFGANNAATVFARFRPAGRG